MVCFGVFPRQSYILLILFFCPVEHANIGSQLGQHFRFDDELSEYGSTCMWVESVVCFRRAGH